MVLNDLLNDWTCSRSYATRDNLYKALSKYKLDKLNGVLVVCVPDTGRWTALFLKSFLDGQNFAFGTVMHHGFKVVG